MSEKTEKKSRKKRTAWTKEELRSVIEAAVLVWLEDTDDLWAHLAKAQLQVLPVDRRRIITGRNVVTPEILEQFEAARKELLGRKEQTEETPAPARAPTPQAVPESIDRAAIIASLTTIEVFELVANRLGPLVAGIQAFAGIVKAHTCPPEHPETPPALTDNVAATPDPVPIKPTPVVKQNALKRTKVLLFGYDTAQVTEIRSKAAVFDLELLFASQQKGEAVPTIPVCDRCILKSVADLSRRAKAALDKRPGPANRIVAGSTDTVLQRLADINSRTRK